MSSPDPGQDLRREYQAASGNPGCLAMAGLAMVALFLSLLGLCTRPAPTLWLSDLLGHDGGSIIGAVLIGACLVYAVLYSLLRLLYR